jgi:hypothetical protein
VTFKVNNVSDPPRNIRIYQTRCAANVAAGDKFNPDWLVQILNFGVLRFMDWMATYGSEITSFWLIADEGYFAWGRQLTSTSAFGPKGGMPLFLICGLANLTDFGCLNRLFAPTSGVCRSDGCRLIEAQ